MVQMEQLDQILNNKTLISSKNHEKHWLNAMFQAVINMFKVKFYFNFAILINQKFIN